MDKEETKKNKAGLSKSKKHLWGYIISFIFVLSGAVHTGSTYSLWAIPFMLGMIHISQSVYGNKKLAFFSIIIVFSSVFINFTQEHNPILYPILFNGHIEIKEDGYYDFNSGDFVVNMDTCDLCKKSNYTKSIEGDKYKVLGIKINRRATYGEIFVSTEEFGQINKDNLASLDDHINLNRPIQIPGVEILGVLMNLSIISLLLLIVFVWPLIFVSGAGSLFAILKKINSKLD